MPATTAAAPQTRTWSATLNIDLMWIAARRVGIWGIPALAKASGVSVSGLRKGLAPGAVPSWSTVAAIATAIAVAPNDLVVWVR